MLDLTFEAHYREKGYTLICGVDEAGRGPLAGPVIAAACILPTDLVIAGLDDSKKLTEKKRERLYGEITEQALAWAVGMASPAEIDQINILNASMLAMRRAIEGLSLAPDFALIDGNVVRNLPVAAEAIVGGDAKVASIAAASVLAKVTRDRLCIEMDKEYPQYGFAKHKGYPTKEHREAVLQYGASPIHRKSFLRFAEKPS